MYTLKQVKETLINKFKEYTFDIKEDEDSLSASTSIDIENVHMDFEFFVSLNGYETAMVHFNIPFNELKDVDTMKSILIGNVMESENHNLQIAYLDEHMEDTVEIEAFISHVLEDITDQAFINTIR